MTSGGVAPRPAGAGQDHLDDLPGSHTQSDSTKIRIAPSHEARRSSG
ncbi:hypothetical protein [Streptomyces sp. LARHCF252]